MNRQFEEIYCRSSESPVLSLEYNDKDDELITGGVSTIRSTLFNSHDLVWKLSKSKRTDGFSISSLRLLINDMKVEEWVGHTALYLPSRKLYVSVDNSLLVAILSYP